VMLRLYELRTGRPAGANEGIEKTPLNPGNPKGNLTVSDMFTMAEFVLRGGQAREEELPFP